MLAIRKCIRQARRRLFFQTWLDCLGWTTLIGVLVSSLIFFLERLLALQLPFQWMWIYLVVGLIVLGASVVWAWSKRLSDQDIAAAIDQQLGLKDRLGTALFAQSIEQNPLAKHVIDDATKVASQLRIQEAFTVKQSKAWFYVPVAGLLLALLYVLMPQFDLLGIEQKRLTEKAKQEQAEQATEQVLAAKESFEQVQLDESRVENEMDPLEAMKTLASLTRKDLSTPQTRQEAVAKLSQVQDKLAQEQQKTKSNLRSLQNAMSQLDSNMSGPADRFADALRRGDFEAAKQQLAQLAASIENLPEDQRQALKEQLANLSQQLQQVSQNQQNNSQQSQQQLQQMLSQSGLSQQQIQQLQQQGMNAQQVQQALQNTGMSAQQAQQLAQQAQQQYQQAQSQQQSQQLSQGLSSTLGQMAQAMSQQNQQGQQGQNSFQPSAWQAGQQLSQMAQMQQQLQQMQQTQSQLGQALNSMAGNNPNPMGGMGGQQAGTSSGGDPFGPEQGYQPQQVISQSDARHRQGRVIASWQEYGEMAKGESTMSFDAAVTEAQEQAEQAVTEDRVPKRFHNTIRKYFEQLPQTTDQIDSAPKAPK